LLQARGLLAGKPGQANKTTAEARVR
jgi:hypothetical protein